MTSQDQKKLLSKTKLPDTPGVYFFVGEKGEIFYIGKATSLRDRVRSYFNGDVSETRGPQISAMLDLVTKIDFTETGSVLEALLLEAKLIKKHQPKYNTKEKSDKSFYFVVITKEGFPRVLLIRERELSHTKNDLGYEVRDIFGPYPYGAQLREAMKIIRKIFPFRDKCVIGKGKPCFNAQIGLCPGVCTGAISKQEYAKKIRNLKLFFEGKTARVEKNLEREMKAYAKALEFEKAQATKRTLFALRHVQDVSLLKDDRLTGGFRMEAYDVAHMSGQHAVGVMTVVDGGIADKSAYRKFRIKSFKGSDDTRALREIIERRLEHADWTLPRLFIVDGGKAQKNTAESILKEAGIEIPVVGVVKDEHHRPKNIIGDRTYARTYEKEILLANSEAHRFAIKYHRELRSRQVKGK